MYYKHTIGQNGENIVCDYLNKNNIKVLHRNFRTHFGEIDFIAKDKTEIIFIEVKTRTNKNYGSPIDSISKYKLRHFITSAKYYLYTRNLLNPKIRFDIIEVYLKDNIYYINHIKQVI